MRKLLIFIAVLGVFFGAGLGLHAGLVAVSRGDTDLSARAQATCAACHSR